MEQQKKADQLTLNMLENGTLGLDGLCKFVSQNLVGHPTKSDQLTLNMLENGTLGLEGLCKFVRESPKPS